MIRGSVTIVALLIFAGVVGAYLYGALAISDADQWDRFKEASAVVLPAVTPVLGSALGFYFGSQSASRWTPPTAHRCNCISLFRQNNSQASFSSRLLPLVASAISSSAAFGFRSAYSRPFASWYVSVNCV